MKTIPLLIVLLFALSFAQGGPILIPDGPHLVGCESGQPPTSQPAGDMLLVNCPPAPPPPSTAYLETFDGTPATPQPWHGDGWSVAVHSRDIGTWTLLEGMAAGHGANCEPPPATHYNNSYEGAVFQCASHIMTAIRASGYGVIYLTPAAMVDFSDGEAVVSFDVSTLRTSYRDWIDVWLTPYEDNLVAPLEDWLPDLNGEPRNAVHIRMKFGSASNPSGVFYGEVISDFTAVTLPQARTTDYATLFTPSAMQRQTFELRISETHIRFGLPDYELWWIDTDMAALGWDTAVVQLGHHSYHPTKGCPTCSPNTWHFDNVSIDPAIPFTIIHASRRYTDPTSPDPVTFDQPAPDGAYLRFSGIGGSLEVSYDGGVTWEAAVTQGQEEYHADHFRTYWTAIPGGVGSVMFRGENWYSHPWHVRDIGIWALEMP